MRRAIYRCLVTAALGLGIGSNAMAANGPVMTLKLAHLYTVDSGALYVGFQSGAMPGCYGNSGGYLWRSHTAFKDLYAQLLTMMAMGGIRAYVVYTPKSTPTGNWDDCTLDGLYLMPE
jgi:hypothetical protein